MFLATQIRQDRLALGLSLAALSALSGVNVSLISRGERGELPLSFENDRRVMRTLVDIRALLEALPYRIDLKDTPTVQRALEDFKQGRLVSGASGSATTGKEAVVR